MWHQLAEFYQVDERWLRQSPTQELSRLTKRFADRPFLLRSNATVSPLLVATMTGIDFHRPEALEDGAELPTTAEVVSLATYFQVTTNIPLLSNQEPPATGPLKTKPTPPGGVIPGPGVLGLTRSTSAWFPNQIVGLISHVVNCGRFLIVTVHTKSRTDLFSSSSITNLI